MARSESNEKLVFNFRTLRLIIGVLAFAFPFAVLALTGKITTSISASYHEAQTRNVFVGFMFVIGTLLASYKGHKLVVPNGQGSKVWVLAKRYQEDLVSLAGGIAAIVTALSPTACDGCAIDLKARLHGVGAIILFSTVVYFCLIAFLRSVNEKLLKNTEFQENQELMNVIEAIRNGKAHGNLLQTSLYRLFPDASVFCQIASAAYKRYDKQQQAATGSRQFPKDQLNRIVDLWNLHGKKITRGWVYLGCGSVIAVILLAFLVVVWGVPALAAYPKLTFWVETVSLELFGLAWMTASQLQYIRKIRLFLKLRQSKTNFIPQFGDI